MQITLTHNPLTLGADRKVTAADGLTPAAVIAAAGLVFCRPYFLLVNGHPLDRRQWDSRVLGPADVCHFVELPRGGGGNGSNPLQVAAQLALVAAAVFTQQYWSLGPLGTALLAAGTAGAAMLVNSFFAAAPPGGPVTGTLPAAEPTYSISSGANAFRLNQPFAEHFGRLKVFPDLAMPAYTEYAVNDWQANNPQTLYFLGIIGVGQYDVETVYIGETPADDFADIDYNILAPGTTPRLVPRMVWLCPALAGQEVTTAYLTAIVNPAHFDVAQIAVDFIFPQGLWSPSLGGAPYTYAYASLSIDARRVDADGQALGAWQSVWDQTITSCSFTPVARSCCFAAPDGPGRYEIRLKRGEPAGGPWDNSPHWKTDRQNNQLMVGDIRGYGLDHAGCGDVTLLELTVRATAQLSGQVANKINVVATRKLYPVSETGLGASLTATRSVVDAAAYMVTSANGGNQAATILDYTVLGALQIALETDQYYFDYRFQGRTTVMGAVVTAARCARAIPYLPGGRFALVQDTAQATDAMLFNVEDFTENSLACEHAIKTADAPTGVRIHYVDAATWTEQSVDCYDDDGSDSQLADVDLAGCTDAQQAYELGMWLYMTDKLARSTVSFTTDAKGHLPYPGQRVAVEMPTSDWAAGGQILHIDGTTIHLSNPVDFGASAAGVLLITTTAGAVGGPYSVTAGATDTQVVGSLPETTPTVATDGDGAAKYIFGQTAAQITSIKVARIEPQSGGLVRISGPIYDASIYDDPGAVPDPQAGPLLEWVGLSYTGADQELGRYNFALVWQGSATAVQIALDTDVVYADDHDTVTDSAGQLVYVADPTVMEDPCSTKTFAFAVAAGQVAVTVTPYDDGTLSPDDALTDTYAAPATPSGVDFAEPVGADGAFTLTWDAVAGAAAYTVQIYIDGDLVGAQTVGAATATWTEQLILEGGGPWSHWTVWVAAVAGGDTGLAAVADLVYDAGLDLVTDAAGLPVFTA